MRSKRVITILISVATIIVAMGSGGTKGDFELIRDSEIMINMLRSLKEGYVDSLSTSQLLRDAISGISRNLDPYTSYIDEEEMADFEIMTTGKYGGIGALIRQADDYVIIAQPYRGFPADEGGLLIGDKILEIDGESAQRFTTEDVSSRLKGTPGSKVKLTIESVLDSTHRSVTLRRRRISIPAIPYYDMLDEQTGYLYHSDFTAGGYEDMRTALQDLESRGMRSLILDYRNNGGGLMQEAIDILSLFLPKGSEVLQIKGRADSTSYRTNEVPLLADMPIIVLINENTASASEIVAGALQDFDRAVLVGQRSFGKGLVQSTAPVGYNSYLKLTTARYYIPSGRSIQAIDYTDHSDGRQVERVADSLRKEYTTRGGRKVLDGGGITPDVEMETEYTSRFASTLYAKELIEKWGEIYFREHYKESFEGESFDAKSFEIKDSDYTAFVEFVLSHDIEYESETGRAIKALERALEADRNEDLEEEVERLKSRLHDDIESNMDRYREQIERYLRHDILLRFHYIEGSFANSVGRDREVARAQEILANESEMQSLLQSDREQ